MFGSRIRIMEAWVPIHRIATLAHLWRGAGRFRRLVGGRSWSILLIIHDPAGVRAPADRRRRETLGVRP